MQPNSSAAVAWPRVIPIPAWGVQLRDVPLTLIMTLTNIPGDVGHEAFADL